MLSKEYQSKKDVYKGAEKDSILDKYGGKEHLEAPPKALLLAQTEEYVVYNRWLTVITVHKAPGNYSLLISLESNDDKWKNSLPFPT